MGGGRIILINCSWPVCLVGWLSLQSSISFAAITSSQLDRWAGWMVTCVPPPFSLTLYLSAGHIQKWRGGGGGGGRPSGVTRGLQHLIEVNRCVAAARFVCHSTSSNSHTHAQMHIR